MEAQAFYTEVIDREEAIAELKAELKEAMDAFCSSNNVTAKGLKKAIREYKEYQKDAAEYQITDADADKIFESLVGAQS